MPLRAEEFETIPCGSRSGAVLLDVHDPAHMVLHRRVAGMPRLALPRRSRVQPLVLNDGVKSRHISVVRLHSSLWLRLKLGLMLRLGLVLWLRQRRLLHIDHWRRRRRNFWILLLGRGRGELLERFLANHVDSLVAAHYWPILQVQCVKWPDNQVRSVLNNTRI